MDNSEKEEELKKIDKNGLLMGRLSSLAYALSVATAKGLERLLDFGGLPFRELPALTPESVESPAIAYFFALHMAEIGIEYHFFDPAFNKRNFTYQIERWKIASEDDIKKYKYWILNHSQMDEICAAIPQLSSSYDEMSDFVKGENALVFSCHTLSSPCLKHDFPFWEFPGEHVHVINIPELMGRINPFGYLCNGNIPFRNPTSCESPYQMLWQVYLKETARIRKDIVKFSIPLHAEATILYPQIVAFNWHNNKNSSLPKNNMQAIT